jgi:hypothetical protein
LTTASAALVLTLPSRAAAHKSGRLRSSRASRAIFCPVLAGIPSPSRT